MLQHGDHLRVRPREPPLNNGPFTARLGDPTTLHRSPAIRPACHPSCDSRRDNMAFSEPWESFDCSSDVSRSSVN
jgi:1,6-anhydro-N-acetylmuramate kinase